MEALLGSAINEAARDLPEGWMIVISVERGAGWAELYNPDGARVDDFESGDLSLYESIRRGVQLAAEAVDPAQKSQLTGR